MALEAMPSYNDLFNFMVYETLNVTQYDTNISTMDNNASTLEKPQNVSDGSSLRSPEFPPAGRFSGHRTSNRRPNLGVQGKKKRRRRTKVCKNKEEAETQRMTHIVVERNRRKQMNEHLAVLRSLMLESYVQKGDQASIVGGAIEFVKELEHLVHSLEAQKLLLVQQAETSSKIPKLPSVEFFSNPDHYNNNTSQTGNYYKHALKMIKADNVADIEVTLIESHANFRIFSNKNPRRPQLSKLVSGFQTLHLTILHLSVTNLDLVVLYSISAKVEEGCQLTSVDTIADAVHHMLRIIEEDAIDVSPPVLPMVSLGSL